MKNDIYNTIYNMMIKYPNDADLCGKIRNYIYTIRAMYKNKEQNEKKKTKF